MSTRFRTGTIFQIVGPSSPGTQRTVVGIVSIGSTHNRTLIRTTKAGFAI
jgi:hypothetical protein